MTTKEFFKKYYPLAQKAAKGTKIYPALILTVASLESNNGLSLLSSKYNNFFGIKAFSSYKGKKVELYDTDYIDGKPIKHKQNFRVYNNPYECFLDFIKVLKQANFIKAGILLAKNVNEQFLAMKKGGYATAPNYVSSLINRLKSADFKQYKVPGTLTIIGIGLAIYLINKHLINKHG
jgi:flagellum-specific peptidoglycan hydrolase FlgJ